GQQPRQRDLSRRRLLPFSNRAKQINQGLIRLERLRRKARQRAAEVGAVKLRVFVNFAGEKTLAQRAVGNEADAEFFEGRYYFLLRGSRPQRVFALEGRERLNGMGATNGFHAGFRKAEVLHLACLNQFLHRSRDVFDGHVRVNPMLIKQINRLEPEPLERAFDGLFDVLGPAVQARRTGPRIAATEVESELGGDHHFSAERREGFADEFFVGVWAVNFSSVEECDAAFHGCPKQRRHLLLVFGWTVGKAHSHATQPDGRDFQFAVSKFALLHI